jgi:hypothetical protein
MKDQNAPLPFQVTIEIAINHFEAVNEYMLVDLPGYIHHGKPTSNPKLTITKLDEITQRFIIDEYHQHIHGETNRSAIQGLSLSIQKNITV